MCISQSDEEFTSFKLYARSDVKLTSPRNTVGTAYT